jgi:outer membrane protein OmpA-like peptidoglycan-associated protein
MTSDRGGAARAGGGVLAAVVLAAFLGACAHQTGTVVLLPEKDGRATAVTVKQGDKEVVLDKPYAAAQTRTDGPRGYTATPQEVEAKFGSALAAQPSRPNAFTLYFVDASDQLTDASKQVLAGVLADIAKHQVPDIVVIGHTDTVGSDTVNDALALRRAQTVRALLIAQGLPAESIVAIGRGKRELLVPTADGVAEARNRRVEILVR